MRRSKNKNYAKAARSILVFICVSMLLPLFFTATSPLASANPDGEGWLSGWMYRIKITINENVVDNNLDNFPVTVFLDNAHFIWAHAKDNGDDIRFTSSDGTTLLSYERERHDKNNGYAEYHVKVPSVSATENTIIYMYFGNASASDGAAPTAVWDANFKMVQHLKDYTTSTILDSTSNAKDGTKLAANEPIEITGIIAKAQDFDGSNDYISLPNGIYPANNVTASMWVKWEGSTATNRDLLCAFKDRYFIVRVANTDSKVYGSFYDGGTWRDVASDSALGTGWTHIAVTKSSTTGLRMYVNGVLQADVDSTTTDMGAYTASNNLIGAYQAGNQNFDGIIDEVRISIVTRSAAWIKAAYNSGNGTLLSVGAEEGVSAGVLIVTNFACNNALIDRDIDITGSGAITATQLRVDVEYTLPNAVVKENVRFIIYDKLDALVDNRQATSYTQQTDNTRRFFVTYNATDNTLVDGQLGGWKLAIEAKDNAGNFGTASQSNLFYVDDLTATQNVENLAKHRIKTSGTVSRVSGIALTTLENVTISDNISGTLTAMLSGNNWENIRAPSGAGQFCLKLKAGVLDGKTDNKSYAFPNISPTIVSVSVTENLVDRKQDYAGSGVTLTTTLTVRICDNDNRDDFNAARIAVRDNLNAVLDNQNVWASKVVVDENTYDVKITSWNPADNLGDTQLGNFDVWGYAADSWSSGENWHDNKFTVNDGTTTLVFNPTSPYCGWPLTVSGTISRVAGGDASATAVLLVDNRHGTFNLGAGNAWTNTYTMIASPNENVGVTLKWSDGVLDGFITSSYKVSENIKFEVYVRFEENYQQVPWVPDANRPLKVKFEWEGGAQENTLTANPENITVAIVGTGSQLIAKITDGAAYWRYVIPQYQGGTLTFVISGDNTKVAMYRFFLQDYTTSYIPPYGQMLIKFWIGTNLAEINSDYWNADWRMTAWLVTGTQYQIWVKGVDAPLRIVGPIDAVVPTEEKTIVVQAIVAELEHIYSEVAWAAWRVDDNIIKVYYQDNLDNTIEASVSIYDMGGNLQYYLQVDNEWFIATWIHGEGGESYNVRLDVLHGKYGAFTMTFPVGLMTGPTGVGGGGVTEIFKMPLPFVALASIIGVMCMGLLFDAPRVHLAVIGMALMVAFLWYMRWLPLPEGLYTVVLILFMAVLFALVRRRY